MMLFERTMLRQLLASQQYAERVAPYMKDEYFPTAECATVFGVYQKFFDQYHTLPSFAALRVMLDSTPNLAESHAKASSAVLDTLEQTAPQDDSQHDFLIAETEKFCQERALYVALRRSVTMLDNPKENPHAIPDILKEALAVSFDTSVGHDFFGDAAARYDFYHRAESRIPFDLDVFNSMTKNGIPAKTLNVVLAGCVHPDTPVHVRYRKITQTWQIETRSIGDIAQLFSEGYEIEVDGPDGFVPVSSFVDKGDWDEFLLVTHSGHSVRCNEAHLFETPSGWVSARDLAEQPYCHVLTHEGIELAVVRSTGHRIPIVDIQVEHPNHRYYTNGVSSHNTNVGKSLFLVHMAAACARMSKNVLYITLEMAEERIAERVDANLMDIPMDDVIALSRDRYLKKLEMIHRTSTSRLLIKEYPTAAAHAGHFRALLHELKLKQNFTPDILFVDYLSICASSRMKMGNAVNSYTYNKSIAEELRGLAVEMNIPIFTAAQFNRDGSSATDPGLDKISESFAIAQTADFIVALTTSEELEKNNQIQAYVLKNRYAKRQSYQKFILGIDTTRMKLYDTGSGVSPTAEPPPEFSATSFAKPTFARSRRRPLSHLKTDDE